MKFKRTPSLPCLLSWAFLCTLLPTPAIAQYVLNGHTVNIGVSSYFRLTEALDHQNGSVWFQNKLNLNFDFEIRAELEFGSVDQDGADGMAFVLQPICTGLGNRGGGIGYETIFPSMAVEYDTWYNDEPGYYDLREDHIALQRNGIVNHIGPDNLARPVALANLENGAKHTTVIQWNKAANNLKVFLDDTLRIDYKGDIIASIFENDPQVFWGFTAATGAFRNDQRVRITNVVQTVEAPYAVVAPSCPTSKDGAIDLKITGNAAPYQFLWSTGSTAEDLTKIPAGDYIVTVTDKNGCKSKYAITLNVVDLPALAISCPANIAVPTDPDRCTAKVSYENPVGNYDCQSTAQTAGLFPGADFPKGVTSNVFVVTDLSGVTKSCQFTVTVTDRQPPAIACPANQSLPAEANECGARATYAAPVGTDNCPGHNTVRTGGLASGAIFPIGVTTNSFTVMDASGSTAKCQFTVTVADKLPPAVTCPANLTLHCDASTVPNMTGLPNVADNCGAGEAAFTDSKTTGSCYSNFTINRTWSVTDLHGNTGACTQVLKVQDMTPPVLNCPAKITVSCDLEPATGTGAATALDNCDTRPTVTHSDKIIGGDCNLLCTIERSWIAADQCGNSTKCVQLITKNIAPLLDAALAKDLNNDRVPDGLVLGVSNSTLEIPPGRGSCIQQWLPAAGTAPSGIKFGNLIVGANCQPGTNPLGANGRLANPLLAEALKLNILVRLNPALGKTKLNTFGCSIPPIVLQGLAPNPDVNELLRVTNSALGNIAMQSHLKELLVALKCAMPGWDICR